MPRKGWKKPPGYAGYVHSPKQSRRGQRTAGAAVLRAARARAGGKASTNAEAETPNLEEDDAASTLQDLAQDATQQDDRLISSRLRRRQTEVRTSELQDGVDPSGGSESFPPEGGMPDLSDGDDMESLAQPQSKKKKGGFCSCGT